MAQHRLARLRLAQHRLASFRLAPLRLASLRLAQYRSAPLRLASLRLAPIKLAPLRSAPRKSEWFRLILLRSTSHRTAHLPSPQFSHFSCDLIISCSSSFVIVLFPPVSFFYLMELHRLHLGGFFVAFRLLLKSHLQAGRMFSG